MKTKMRIQSLKLSKGDFTKTFNEALEVQFRQAARAWLRAVLTRVPVFTGMARGSLIPVGQYLKVAIPITPVAFVKGRGPAVGEGLGAFEFEHLKTIIKFTFSTDVAHYEINEFTDARPEIHLKHEPIPWHSLKAGSEAFRGYLKENIPSKLPKLTSFFVRQDITIGHY